MFCSVSTIDCQECLSCFAREREVLDDDGDHNLHRDQPETIAALPDEFFF